MIQNGFHLVDGPDDKRHCYAIVNGMVTEVEPTDADKALAPGYYDPRMKLVMPDLEKMNPNHDELGRFASAGTAYHGTSADRLARIMQHGLLVNQNPENRNPNTPDHPATKSVYVTTEKGGAMLYATTVAEDRHADPVVLTLKVPKHWREKFVTDEEHDAPEYKRFEGNVNPKWIVKAEVPDQFGEWVEIPLPGRDDLLKAVPEIIYMVVDLASLNPVEKINPNHDERGRFASAPSSAGGSGGGEIPDGGMKAYVSMVNDAHHGQPSAASFLLEHGRAMPMDDKSLIGGTPQQCYKNAATAMTMHDDLTYCEGFVSIHGIPVAHAWTIDPKGIVRDYTLTSKDRDIIKGYFGVPLKTDFVSRTLLRSKVYGILVGSDNPKTVRSVVMSDPKESVAT